MSKNSIIGLDLGSIGRSVFGGVHMAGKALASAFGFGGAAQSLENLETQGGLLPDWAKSGGASAKQGPPVIAVAAPDYVAVLRPSVPQPVLIAAPLSVSVLAGKRFPGNGYQHGEPFGQRFSFGVDKPDRVDVKTKGGKTQSFADAKQVWFFGGSEIGQSVAGDIRYNSKRSDSMREYDVLGRRVLGELAAAGDEDAAAALEQQDSDDVATSTPGDYQVSGDAWVSTGTREVDEDASRYLRGADVLGAMARKNPTVPNPKPVAPRVGITIRSAPATGRQFTSMHLTPTRKTDHAGSIKTARDVGKRAIAVGQKIDKALATAVHGLGAAAAKPGARVAALMIKRAADNAVKAGQAVLKQADAHESRVKTLIAHKDAGVRSVSAKMDPSGKQAIHGEALGRLASVIGADYWEEVCGEGYDVLGEDWMDIVGDGQPPPIPDPLNPGYMTDGTPDPNYSPAAAGATGSAAPAPSASSASVAATGMPGPPDYGVGPAPTGAPPLVAGQDFVPDPGFANDVSVYGSKGSGVALPLGAVIYDGSQAFPEKGVGSFTYFHDHLPGGAAPDGGGGSGYFWGDDGKWKNWWASSYHDGIAIDLRVHQLNPQERASLPVMAANSVSHKWGPLIGNPQGGWTKGLRYDVDGDQWFWFYDQAPQWATAADTQARANKAALDYKAQVTAAAADYAAAVAQDKLDAQNAANVAKQNAVADAAAAHQQQQELQAAQHQADVAATQNQQQQAQLDQQWEQTQIALQQQRQEMLKQRASYEQQQAQFLQAHPDLMAQAMASAAQQGAVNYGDASQQAGDQGYAGDQGGDDQGIDWGDAATADVSPDATAADLEADLPQ